MGRRAAPLSCKLKGFQLRDKEIRGAASRPRTASTMSLSASNIQAAPAEVKWLSGAEYVKRFDYPGERLFTKVFCSECGSGLPFLNKSGKKLFIPAGSLDSEPGIQPNHNIFWSDRSSWYEAGISAPRSEGFIE